MKAKIHPKWYPDCKVTCACGNEFTVGATVSELAVEVCSKCHPFFTGTMKFVDTAGRVEAFKARQKGASKKAISKAEKRKLKREQKLKEELERPDTLTQLRSNVSKVKKVSKVSKK